MNKLVLNKCRQQIYDQIKSKLDAGEELFWEKDWEGKSTSGFLFADFKPQINFLTNKRYKGINLVSLFLSGQEQGFKDNRWATLKQWNKIGHSIKAGQKSTTIEKWGIYDKANKCEITYSDIREKEKTMEKEEFAEWLKQLRYINKEFSVFNAEQLKKYKDLPKMPQEARKQEENKEPNKPKFTEENALAEQIIKNSEATVYHDGGNRAYYDLLNDKIHVPNKDDFHSIEGYYGTVLHEIGHSTGSKSRLSRDGIINFDSFGSERYAKEELVAEMISVFMQAEIGVKLDEFHVKNHTAYIKSWSKKIGEDPNYLFDAISKADKGSNYILDHYLLNKKENTEDAKQAELERRLLAGLNNSSVSSSNIKSNERCK